MWLLYTILHAFTMALVNYSDEYLTGNSKVEEESSNHMKIGGLLMISTLLSVVTIGALGIYLDDFSIDIFALSLAISSAIPMVALWAAYFYLFLLYPAHQVVPLFGLSSIWFLIIEVILGASVNMVVLMGILFLVLGAYFLDAGTFKWQIPTKLLLLMIPVSLLWSITLYMVRVASETSPVITVFFYQYIGIGIIGVLLLLFVRPYREGLVHRIKTQGKNFLGFSLISESIAQVSFLFVMLAIALAPLGTYVTAMSGVNSIFLLAIFYFFPINKRNEITKVQWYAILLIVFGTFVIEFWK